MSGEAPPTQRSPGRDGEHTTAVLHASRLCERCLMNLCGRPVVRDERTGLRLVHCPGCGRATCVDSFPWRPPWGLRWRAGLAAIWLVILGSSLIAASMVIGAMSFEVGVESARRYQLALQRGFGAYVAERAGDDNPQAPVAGATDPGLLERWLDEGGEQAVLRDLGGWWSAVDWGRVLQWHPAIVVFFFVGGACGTALAGKRARDRALVAGAFVLLGGTVMLPLGLVDTLGFTTQEYVVARRTIAPGMMTIAIGAIGASFVLGAIAGPSLARLGLRALLPPAWRGPFDSVWAVRLATRRRRVSEEDDAS